MPAYLGSSIPLGTILWGAALAISWLGWGSLVNRVRARGGEQGGSWALVTVWGISLSVVIGGLANWSHMISEGFNTSYTTLGLLLGGLEVGTRLRDAIGTDGWNPAVLRSRAERWLFAASPVLVGLVIFRNWLLLPCCGLNRDDDFHGYLVFPLKMLEAGGLTGDPFNMTQAATLGGQAFLQSLLLTKLPVVELGVLDPLLCSVIVAGLLAAYQRTHGAGAWTTAVTTALAFCLPLVPPTNASAGATLTLLFLGLHVTLASADAPGRSGLRIVTPALVTAGLIALKVTALLFVLPLFAIHYGLRLYEARSSRGAVRALVAEAAWLMLAIVLLLAPWVASTGWPSNDLLQTAMSGRDGVVSPLRLFPFSRLEDLMAPELFLPVLVLSAAAWLLNRAPQEDRRAIMTLTAAVLIGALATLWTAAGMTRYASHFTVVPTMLLAAEVFRAASRSVSAASERRRRRTARDPVMAGTSRGPRLAVLCIALALGSGAWVVARVERSHMSPLAFLSAHLASAHDDALSGFREYAAAIRQAQSAVPPGQVAAVRVVEPFLLDFARNPISVIDYYVGRSPAAVSATPDEQLAERLLSKHIRYLLYEDGGAFSFALSGGDCRQADTAWPVIARLHGESGMDAVECSEAVKTSGFIDALRALTKTRRHVYDGGRFMVLDLSVGQGAGSS